MSTVGLGGSILFRQLLPFPVYANVYLSSIGLSGGGIVMASQVMRAMVGAIVIGVMKRRSTANKPEAPNNGTIIARR